MKSKNVIEINGKLYDAKTGTPFKTPKTTKPAATPVARTKAVPVRKKMSARSVDGFTVRSRSKPTATGATKTTGAPLVSQKKAAASRTTSSSAKLKTKRSTTLNRSTVKQPSAINTKSVPATKKAVVSSGALQYASQVRTTRAAQVTKSNAISKFATKSQTATKLTAHLEKTHRTKSEDARQPVPNRTSTKEQLAKKALDQAVVTAPTKTRVSKKQTKKPHFVRYATTAFTVLLLAGYVAYLNVPSISIKVAAHRAGFAANLPTHKPAGYSLKGPIAYSPGQVTLNFASNTDQRKFTLKQQPTTWDSTALLENFVTKKSPNYVTYQDSGLTIYITEGGDAAWVNGGKFYQVEAENTQLDTDQLLKLATSV